MKKLIFTLLSSCAFCGELDKAIKELDAAILKEQQTLEAYKAVLVLDKESHLAIVKLLAELEKTARLRGLE